MSSLTSVYMLYVPLQVFSFGVLLEQGSDFSV